MNDIDQSLCTRFTSVVAAARRCCVVANDDVTYEKQLVIRIKEMNDER